MPPVIIRRSEVYTEDRSELVSEESAKLKRKDKKRKEKERKDEIVKKHAWSRGVKREIDISWGSSSPKQPEHVFPNTCSSRASQTDRQRHAPRIDLRFAISAIAMVSFRVSFADFSFQFAREHLPSLSLRSLPPLPVSSMEIRFLPFATFSFWFFLFISLTALFCSVASISFFQFYSELFFGKYNVNRMVSSKLRSATNRNKEMIFYREGDDKLVNRSLVLVESLEVFK